MSLNESSECRDQRTQSPCSVNYRTCLLLSAGLKQQRSDGKVLSS